jgi:FlaA1/EpsC-like NDP-sugar epimerase
VREVGPGRIESVAEERTFKRVMVTGGAGFIGSNYVHLLLE